MVDSAAAVAALPDGQTARFAAGAALLRKPPMPERGPAAAILALPDALLTASFVLACPQDLPALRLAW